MSPPSALDRPIALAELIDAAALDEVLNSYAEFHGVALAVIDGDGQILAHAGGALDLCETLRDRPAGLTRCEAKLHDVRGVRPSIDAPAPTACDCFTGLRYQVQPLHHEGSLLGTLILGPYHPQGRPAGLTGVVQSLLGPGGLAEGERAAATIAALADPQACRILEHIARVLGVLLHNAWARHLTAELHVATLATTYEDLADKSRRLSAAMEQMQEVDRLKSSFLATVSHELRTPLTSVIGYSEMLIEGLAGPLNREQRDYVQIIMEKGDQLLQLITGILDVSRMEAGTLRIAREPVDLLELVDSAVAVMTPLARRKRLELRGVVPAHAPRGRGDREKLRQGLVNLVGNSIKFTPEGGRVEIEVGVGPLARDTGLDAGALVPAPLASSTPVGGPPASTRVALGMQLRVRDSGIGIAPDKQARIFEPFFQVDSSSTREYGGTGLGLTLVKSYVEAHGGRVWVDSELGRGSAFTITLPAVDEDLDAWLLAGRVDRPPARPTPAEPEIVVVSAREPGRTPA